METDESSVLLRRYAEEGSQEAFRLLMHRYVDLIYSAALRRLEGDGAAAEDVVQRVFAELAVRARSLKADCRLGGWLYRCAVNFAADVHKASIRRRNREQKAAALSPLTLTAPEPNAWEEVAPRLDDAMQRLPAVDRDALVLRFFEDRPLRAVGHALGLSEDAAQKRVSRALARLRDLLRKRGVAATAAGLATGLTANSTLAAPPGLAAAALPALPPVATGSLLTFHSLMHAKPILTAAAIVAAVAIPLFLVLRHGDETGESDRRLTANKGSGASHAGPASPSVKPSDEISANFAARNGGKKPAAAETSKEEGSKAEAEAKSRKRAEEVTLQRYNEKIERLTRKLNLTPEQAEKVAAYHQAQRAKWVEYLTGAGIAKADAQYYSLETGYREDIPPALQPLLTEEQMKSYREHDTNKRTNHIESMTSGEINYLAQRLDLDPQKKDALFQKLAEINRTDLFTDLTGVKDLPGIEKQAEFDLARRREAFVSLLDEQQMKVWESVVAGYRRELLHRFGHREAATAGAAGEKAADASPNG